MSSLDAVLDLTSEVPFHDATVAHIPLRYDPALEVKAVALTDDELCARLPQSAYSLERFRSRAWDEIRLGDLVIPPGAPLLTLAHWEAEPFVYASEIDQFLFFHLDHPRVALLMFYLRRQTRLDAVSDGYLDLLVTRALSCLVRRFRVSFFLQLTVGHISSKPICDLRDTSRVPPYSLNF